MISEMFESLAQIRGLLNTLLEGAPLDVHENIYLTTVAAMLHHGARAPRSGCYRRYFKRPKRKVRRVGGLQGGYWVFTGF